MKRIFSISIKIFLLVFVLIVIAKVLPLKLIANSPSKKEITTLSSELQNGDIIFQTSQSSQSKAIQLATNSKYCHVGMIYIIDNKPFVYEAIQPVTITPLKAFISRGQNGHYVVKRLKNANEILTSEVMNNMKTFGEQYLGKPYDLYFEWTDDRIYCSELVWKIYNEATGLELGALQKIKDFDLSHQAVKLKMQERYGNNIPMNEQVISPAAMFNSDLLYTVRSN